MRDRRRCPRPRCCSPPGSASGCARSPRRGPSRWSRWRGVRCSIMRSTASAPPGIKRVVVNVHYLPTRWRRMSAATPTGSIRRDLGRARRTVARDRRRRRPRLAAARRPALLRHQHRQFLGRRSGRHAAAARQPLGRGIGWTRCCSSCRWRARRRIAGRAISTWTLPRAAAQDRLKRRQPRGASPDRLRLTCSGTGVAARLAVHQAVVRRRGANIAPPSGWPSR